MSTSDCDHPSNASSTLHDQSVLSHPIVTEKRVHVRPTSVCHESPSGTGTSDDPYVVAWLPDDPEDPYNWDKRQKWIITMQVRVSHGIISPPRWT